MQDENPDNTLSERELRLDELFRAYRRACPEPDPGANFMPEMWAKIEARQLSTNLFGRMAKALVTVALAASVILGIMVSSVSQSSLSYNGTYLEALSATDQSTSMEPLNVERISEMEQQ